MGATEADMNNSKCTNKELCEGSRNSYDHSCFIGGNCALRFSIVLIVWSLYLWATPVLASRRLGQKVKGHLYQPTTRGQSWHLVLSSVCNSGGIFNCGHSALFLLTRAWIPTPPQCGHAFQCLWCWGLLPLLPSLKKVLEAGTIFLPSVWGLRKADYNYFFWLLGWPVPFAWSPRDLVKTLPSGDGGRRHDFRVAPSMYWTLIFFFPHSKYFTFWGHTNLKGWEALQLLSVEPNDPHTLKSDCHLQSPFTIYPRNRVPHTNGDLEGLPGYPSISELSIQVHSPHPQPILNPPTSAFLATLFNYQSNTCSFSKIKIVHKIYIK